MPDKPGRGGRRAGAGRPPKPGRLARTVTISPAAWAGFKAQRQPRETLNDALDRIGRALVPEAPPE